MGDDSPVKNENLKVILAKNTNVFYKEILPTDANGYFEFIYDPRFCKDECKKHKLSESPEDITIKVRT
jgi:hypothetical protein